MPSLEELQELAASAAQRHWRERWADRIAGMLAGALVMMVLAEVSGRCG